MKLDTHLHRIGNDTVAAYLLVTDEGITLIDAGLPGHFHELTAELATINRTIADIKGVVLTHGDSDHIGFAERLRRDHGIPVFIHEADASRAMGGPKPKPAKDKMRVGPMLTFLVYAARKGGLRTNWLTSVTTVSDGDVLDLPGAPRVIWLPGHSEGSIAIHSSAADALFVGDALTTRNVLTGTEGPQLSPFTDEPARALAALQSVMKTNATWVLPGHGAPWELGVSAAIAAITAAGTTLA